MRDVGKSGDNVTKTTAPAVSVKKAVAKVIAAEKQATVQEKEIVSGQMKLEDLEQERLIVKKTVEKKTVTKKPVEKKEAAVKSVSAAKVTEAVQTEKPAEEKKPAEAKKTETKEAAKTTASKTKTTASKAAKAAKEPVKKIVLQYHGNELDVDNLIEKVKAAYAAEGNSATAIKSVELYIKPEENMVYYVIDGYASGTNIY